MRIVSVVCLLLLVCTLPLAAQNLVQNGEFNWTTTITMPNGSEYVAWSHWYFKDLYWPGNFINPMPAPADAYYYGRLICSDNDSAVLYTVINAPAGTYNVSWIDRGRQSASGTSSFAATIYQENGSPISLFTNSDSDTYWDWTSREYTVQLNGGATYIAFEKFNGTEASIDNVSVALLDPIPEPGSLFCLSTGLAALVGVALRRKNGIR